MKIKVKLYYTFKFENLEEKYHVEKEKAESGYTIEECIKKLHEDEKTEYLRINSCFLHGTQIVHDWSGEENGEK